MTVHIRPAETGADLDEARLLFRAFLAWHRERQGETTGNVESYFDDVAWESELAGLPGAYAPPDGALLIAWVDGRAVGCVALRALGDGRCEMKRMFVDLAGRGLGTGRALAEAVIAQARSAGHTQMFLDTSIDQHEAIGLYRSLGFEEVEPYYDVDPALRDWLVYLRLSL